MYPCLPPDPKAVLFSSESFPALRDPQADAGPALCQAIQRVKSAWGYGVVYIPQGVYYMTQTVFVPKSVRLVLIAIVRTADRVPHTCGCNKQELALVTGSIC